MREKGGERRFRSKRSQKSVESTLTKQEAIVAARGLLGAEKVTGCGASVNGSVQAVRSIDEPGVDVLAHRGQDDAKEPAVTASGARLEEHKVVLFAFDRSFGTGARIQVTLPEQAVSRDEGMQAVVLFRIGEEDAAIR